MAMIKCSECGKDISDKAEYCVHCGSPVIKMDKCSECGKEVSPKANVCPNCGNILKEKIVEVEPVQTTDGKINGLCLSGMIVSFVSFLIDLFALVSATALVLSIVGLVNTKKSKEDAPKNRTFAIVGIVCSSIEFVLKVIQIFASMFLVL